MTANGDDDERFPDSRIVIKPGDPLPDRFGLGLGSGPEVQIEDIVAVDLSEAIRWAERLGAPLQHPDESHAEFRARFVRALE